MTGRGTSNSNQRGGSADRARRRRFLLQEFGDGETCPCYRCGKVLDDSTVQADRILAGIDGGTYERGNIRPACGPCNITTGNLLRDHRRRFPAGHLVRFKRGRTLWRIVDGESEPRLVLQAVESRVMRCRVDRSRLVDAGPEPRPEGTVPSGTWFDQALGAVAAVFAPEPTRDDFALVPDNPR